MKTINAEGDIIVSSKKISAKQIIKTLHDEITQMQNADNQKYATEKEIMERFDVSRMTARLILSRFVSDGLLYREKGKGVFINKRIIQRSQYIYSFTEQMKERGLTPSSRVLSFKKILPLELVRLSLGMAEGEMCFAIKRLRLADDKPFSVEIIYTPVALFPGLERFDFETDSFYRILEQEYHKEFSYDKEVVSATEVRGSVADKLYGIDKGVALKVVDTLYDIDQKPLEYTESFYNADRYSYTSITQKR